METVSISREKYNELVKKAILSDRLLIKLVRGLEDVRAGRIRRWNSSDETVKEDC